MIWLVSGKGVLALGRYQKSCIWWGSLGTYIGLSSVYKTLKCTLEIRQKYYCLSHLFQGRLFEFLRLAPAPGRVANIPETLRQILKEDVTLCAFPLR